MKRLILTIAILGGGVSGWIWIQNDSPPVLETIPTTKLNIDPVENPGAFLADQVSLLADSDPGRMDPVASATPETDANVADSGVSPQEIAEAYPGGLLYVSEESIPRVAESANPDDRFLRQVASQFAYVEFKGTIGGRSLASFCIDPKTGDREIAGEGDTYREITIAKVQKESVLLTYKSAAPLKKPLVQLDIEYKPMNQLTPEEAEARHQRYQELYGNRFQAASLEYRKKNGGKVVNPPSSEDQLIAAQVYQETYGTFFREMQEEDSEENNRDFPLDAPTMEESVSDYFETYWPDQVEWEISDEEATEGE